MKERFRSLLCFLVLITGIFSCTQSLEDTVDDAKDVIKNTEYSVELFIKNSSEFAGAVYKFEASINGSSFVINETSDNSVKLVLSPGILSVKVKAYKDNVEIGSGSGSVTISSNAVVLSVTLTPVSKVATPVISPVGGTYNKDAFEGITITTATSGATIRYTLDGSDVNESSTLYSGKITITDDATVKAKAYKTGITASEQASAVYDLTTEEVVSPVVISPVSGSYILRDFAGVTMTTATSGASIRYTLNGTEPTASSALYSAKVSLAVGYDQVIKAKAFKTGYVASSVTTVEYDILENPIEKVANPVITIDGSSPYTVSTKFTITCATDGATIYYTTDGTVPTTSSPVYSGSFKFTKAGTYELMTYAVKSGMTNSDVIRQTVTITSQFDGVIIYVKSGSAPAIWVWETTGNEIPCSKRMGYTWNTQPSMEAATGMNDNTGWYMFKIPATYVSGGALSFILNKGSTVTTTKVATFWYDNGTYSDTDPSTPPVPTKPTVSISPSTGKVKGTAKVTISATGCTDAPITSISGTFNGKSLTFTGNTCSVTVSDYITSDGATGNISVTAVNSVGSTTEAGTLTRDDSTVVSTFTWRNANIYFVMTDRFNNGDTANDHSYNRSVGEVDAANYATRQGTFHGGDIKGLTAKLDYLDDLGVNAIWLTAPYEQIHGALCGTGFKHYAYHGYYALDFTEMDKNMGTVEEFRTFVKAAHAKGIRVVMDIVMNHAGYPTPVDAEEYSFGGLDSDWRTIYYNTSESNYNWYNDYVGEASSRGAKGMMVYDADWSTNYWGISWLNLVGTRFKGYTGVEGNSVHTLSNGLPDFFTESDSTVGISGLMKNKWAKEATGYDDWIIPAAKKYRTNMNKTVRMSLVAWLSSWVEEFGIDGFRCDTAKHVEKATWKALKEACSASLKTWRASSNSTGDTGKNWTDDFWMTGEHYDWGYDMGDSYFSNGFDSMINFNFPKDGNVGSKWAIYANDINSSSNNVLSYISSHDKGLTRSNMINQGTNLLLSPGGVQIFYGDETERPASVSGEQGWRSQMTFNTGATTLAHWQKVGKFRRSHPSVGAGSQTTIESGVFKRTYTLNGVTDTVVIAIGKSGSTSVSVSGAFADGTTVKNAYDGTTGVVSGGKVTFTANNGVILIEAAN